MAGLRAKRCRPGSPPKASDLDAADEHTYWYPDDAPNIFDKNYARKTAYKGVCDGIAGKDISEDFTGDMWMNGK